MKLYDCLFILPGTFSESEALSLTENLKELLNEAGAVDIKLNNAGRAKLAYPIKDNHYGYLLESTFSLAPEQAAALTKKLKLEPIILRFMFTCHQAKEIVKRRTIESAAAKTAPIAAPAKTIPAADMKSIDEKIEEILQQDNLVV